MYGLACGGAKGVEEVCRSILADTEISLGLAGYRNLSEIWGKRKEIITQVQW
jgi:lactate 2-monooxygenase